VMKTPSALCATGMAILGERLAMASRIAAMPAEIFNAGVPIALLLPAKPRYPLAVRIAPHHRRS
jgi:hypothetical protein